MGGADDDDHVAQDAAALKPWDVQLRQSMHSLRERQTGQSPSHTRVLEAAAHLLCSGLLNVKGTKRLNVKQARALFHWAWWLQGRMSKQWIDEGFLDSAPFDINSEPLRHVLTGGAGAGKAERF